MNPSLTNQRRRQVFKSFFPRPKVFLLSALIFAAISVAGWYWLAARLDVWLAIPKPAANAEPVIGLAHFATPHFLYFYVYYVLCCAIFASAWFYLSPHRWQWWSIVGSMLIIFSTYFSVQVSVAINNWRRPFFDSVQNALSGNSTTTAADLYKLLVIFAQIAFVWIAVYVATRFLVSHYIFRWRTAMNDYYMSRWPEVRGIEGAAQRVQEDTMRFASIMEDLGVSVIDSVMTLFAFLPVLYVLSAHIAELPIVGKIAAPLLWASLFWSIFGTVLLAIAGIKLPGLNFRNQRVEAAYRKELVYGEDDADRAQPMTVSDLFANVRTNYFRLYFHYAYFNVFRSMYLQADNIFAYMILIPTIAAGKITFGILQQILTAFSQVSSSFQYLVNSWTTIIELLSIRKRLMAFEAMFAGQKLPEIEQEVVRQVPG
jgi:peptide/bleomycin uptake transporter